MKSKWRCGFLALALGFSFCMGREIHAVWQMFIRITAGMIGSASMNHTTEWTIQMLFQEFSQKDINAGILAFAKAGYQNSWQRLLGGQVMEAIGKYALFACVFFLAGFALFVIVNCKTNKQIKQLYQQNELLRKEGEELRICLEQERREVEFYEGNLYHQMKTPLTSLRLMIESDTCSANDAERTLNQIDHMDRLLHLLLREKQLSQAEMKFHYHPAEINTMLQDVIQSFVDSAFVLQSKLQLISTERECVVDCDELWLKECFSVLIENAMSHGEQGNIIIDLHTKQGLCLVDFSSPGLIKPEIIPHLFERFFSSQENHFGIGLHMAKTIAEMHHGSLHVMNQESLNRTVFQLKLPMLRDERIYLS